MNQDDFTYRMAEPTDGAALVALINRAFEVELQFFTARRIDLVDTLDHFEKGTFLVAEYGNDMVACNYVELRADVGYFGLLSVEPDQQGRGLGTELIDQAEDICRSAGCLRMQIRVLNHRTELPPFYEKLNYRVIGIEQVEQVASARTPYHFIIMEKHLV